MYLKSPPENDHGFFVSQLKKGVHSDRWTLISKNKEQDMVNIVNKTAEAKETQIIIYPDSTRQINQKSHYYMSSLSFLYLLKIYPPLYSNGCHSITLSMNDCKAIYLISTY